MPSPLPWAASVGSRGARPGGEDDGRTAERERQESREGQMGRLEGLGVAKKKPSRGRRKKGTTPAPICKAILLCELAIREESGKISLINLFNGFLVRKTPGHTKEMTAYLQLIEGIGDYVLTVEVHDLSGDKVIARAQSPAIRFSGRFVQHDILMTVPKLPIDHPGTYDFVVLANGSVVDRQKFVVAEMEKEETEDEPRA